MTSVNQLLRQSLNTSTPEKNNKMDSLMEMKKMFTLVGPQKSKGSKRLTDAEFLIVLQRPAAEPLVLTTQQRRYH